MNKIITIISISFVLLTGCTSVVSKSSNVSVTKTNINFKNYVIGEEFDCNVGDKMIVRKKFSGNSFSSKKVFYRPSNIAVVRVNGGENQEYQITKNDKLDQIALYRNGEIQYAVLLDEKWGRAALIDKKTGLITGKCIYRNNFGSWLRLPLFSASVEPSTTIFNENIEPVLIAVDRTEFYENIELIFVGRNKNSLNILYREYSSDDLVRVAFFQNLTYDIDAGDIIRFKSFKLKIVKSNNESIKYKVLED